MASKLVNVIKKEEAITWMKTATFESGATLPPWRKIREKDKKIQTFFEHYNSGNGSLNDYLEVWNI